MVDLMQQSEIKSLTFTAQPSPKTKLVITDVDGTLSSFWDYFVPAMRDFLRQISVRLEIPLLELSGDIGRIIDRRGTHEYPWLLEETSFAWEHFADKPEQFIDDFVKPFWEALDENRRKYLRPFPCVLETLSELRRQGIKIVALSDAPEYMARVRNMQIFDGLLDAVYALETVEPGEQDSFRPISFAHGRERVKSMIASTSALKTIFHILPRHFEKPCPEGIDQVLKDYGVFPQEAIFVGDNLARDGMVSACRGIRFVWAHYGHHLPAEYEEIVNYSLKPQGESCTLKPLPTSLITAVAARYDEILNHI